MKTIKVMVFGGIALAALPALAQNNNLVDHANAQLAIEDVGSPFSNGTALVLTAGKAIDKNGLGIEAELTKTISEAEYSQSGSIFGVNYGVKSKVDILSLGGYAVYTLPVQRNFDLRFRGGLVYRKADATVSCSGTYGCYPASIGSDNTLGIGFGVGATYAINNQMNVIAEYTSIPDVTHLSAGLQFKF